MTHQHGPYISHWCSPLTRWMNLWRDPNPNPNLKVLPANPFEYLNAAIEKAEEKRRRDLEEDDDRRQPKRGTGDRGGPNRGRGRGRRRGRKSDVPVQDRVTCHNCGIWGDRKINCKARSLDVDSVNFFGEV